MTYEKLKGMCAAVLEKYNLIKQINLSRKARWIVRRDSIAWKHLKFGIIDFSVIDTSFYN